MLVQQAIVSTPNSRALKQNELVAKSESIDDELVESLCHWSPKRNELASGQSQSINFIQLRADTFAISRSAFGQLDSSRDGGRQIITHAVLLDRDQLAGYHNNIALVAHVLRSNGSMSFQAEPSQRLSPLEVPDHAFVELGELSRTDYSGDSEKILHAIEIHENVVILGLDAPLRFLCSFLADLPITQRLDFSFATGQKVSDERTYTLQFFPDEEPDLLQELASRQMRTILLGPKSRSRPPRVTGSLNDC